MEAYVEPLKNCDEDKDDGDEELTRGRHHMKE